MSIANIESDYTPKDFLERLLGKPIKQQPLSSELLKPSASGSNSQSTIDDNTHVQVISPKSTSIRRVHFQSVQNIQSPQKRLIEPPVLEQKVSIEFKENLRKKSLKKQYSQHSHLKSTQIVNIDQNPQSSTQINQQLKSECKVYSKIEENKVSSNQKDLLLQKTQLLLKAVLKSKVNQNQIESILDGLKRGIESPIEFDKLISEYRAKQHESIQQNIPKTHQNKHTQTRKNSHSLQCNQTKIKNGLKRVRSEQKVRIQIKSKKQKKRAIQQSKQTILKQIKQLKQLVFLNQKSLKRTRKVSMY